MHQLGFAKEEVVWSSSGPGCEAIEDKNMNRTGEEERSEPLRAGQRPITACWLSEEQDCVALGSIRIANGLRVNQAVRTKGSSKLDFPWIFTYLLQ